MKAIPCLLLALAIPFTAHLATAQDAKGCKDTPIVSRFPGSVIDSCRQMDDDTYAFHMGPGKPDNTVEGKYLQVHYIYPTTASKAQVVRNFSTAMRSAGYTVIYDTGDYGDCTYRMGKTWIFIAISGGHWYEITSVTETALTQDVVATAAALSTGLNGAGHIVVPGILFDTGKADIKPESAAALVEVSKLLTQNPRLKLYIVGHTDNVGVLASNLDLSHRRAEAVVQALITQYHVAAARLSSFGAGPYCPVQSNDTDDGRSLNRRVEIVKQ